MILELQNAILEMIAKGEPLANTVERLCVKVEAAVPEISSSVLWCREVHFPSRVATADLVHAVAQR
jgi:hypothetical protein